MSDLWKAFVAHLATIDGVERRDIRLMEGLLHAASSELRRSGRNPSGEDRDEAGVSPLRAEALHKDLIEACANVLSAAPLAARAVKAALRTSLQALVSRSADGDDNSTTSQQRPAPLFSSLVAIPGPDIGVLLTVAPLEPNIEPLVQAMGPYVRHPEGRRALSGSGGVLQHLATADLVQRYLRWSDQRVENVHSGVGGALATAHHIHRRKLVFLISADHAKPWHDADAGRSASTRFPWKLMKESSSTMSVLREPHAPSREEDPLAEDAEEDGFRSSRFTPVHITEVQSIRVAAGLDHHGAMQLLSVVKGNLIQWEKQSQMELEKRLKRIHEAQLAQQQRREQQHDDDSTTKNGSMNVLPNAPPPIAVTPERLAPSAHYMQVVILLDTENHHVGEQMMTTLRTTLLPKLQQTRQAARASRAKHSMKVAFDLFPQVVLFGKRILLLVLPPALEATGARSAAARSMASSQECGVRSDDAKSFSERIASVAAHVQACIKEYGTMVSVAVPSEAVLPPSLEADLQHHVWGSEIIVSFHRLSSSRVDGLSGNRSVSLQLHYPGGERLLAKHALQLFFQLWCVDVASPSFKPPASAMGAAPVVTKSVRGADDSDAKQHQQTDDAVDDVRSSLMQQYDAFVTAHREVLHRLCVICRIATDDVDNVQPQEEETMAVFSDGDDSPRQVAHDDAAAMLQPTGKANNEAPLLRITYADVLNVVLRISLVYLPPSLLQEGRCDGPRRLPENATTSATDLLPMTSTRIARRLVGPSTALTLLASLFASYGINTVVYEDNEPPAAADRSTVQEQPPHVVSILLGFSLMQDVSGYGQGFVDDCWYAPLQRQLAYLRNRFWPLLIGLRHRAVVDIRRASVENAKRLYSNAAPHGAGSHVVSLTFPQSSNVAMSKQRRASSRRAAAADVHNLRQVFVVAVSEDEDAETLERSDKRGELGNALSMPLLRVFLIPTPFLLAAQQQQAAATPGRRSSVSDAASDAGSSISRGGKAEAPSLKQPSGLAFDKSMMVDDAPFLVPHVYQPEDADALGRIAHEFAERLEDRRYDALRQSVLSNDGTSLSVSRVAKVLMGSINLRVCSAAVLDAGRLTDDLLHHNRNNGGGGVGPLLPCVEISLDYNSGPHIEADDSLLVGQLDGATAEPVSNAELLIQALRSASAPRQEGGAQRTSESTTSLLGTILSDWILSTAAETMEDSQDVARVKEEALVHAIRTAESMLTGEPMATHGGGVVGKDSNSSERRDPTGTADVTSSENDDDGDDSEEHRDGAQSSPPATKPFGGADEEEASSSSWWWWWGGGASAASAAATPDITGLRFNLQSTKLERKRVPQ